MKYRIAWKFKVSGRSGHGTWISNREMLKDIIEIERSKYPDINYWIETGMPIEKKKEEKKNEK